QRWDRTTGRDGLMAPLTGTGTLIRLILRRDRILLALFIALPVLITASQTAAFQELYPTAEARQSFTQQSNGNPATLGMLGPALQSAYRTAEARQSCTQQSNGNPAPLGMLGPIFAPGLGSLVAWRVGVMGMLLAGIPSLLLVIRHTRTEEESGRRELLSSTTVGRIAPLTAALVAEIGRASCRERGERQA